MIWNINHIAENDESGGLKAHVCYLPFSIR